MKVPRLKADIYFGDPDAPAPDWRKELGGSPDTESDDATPEDRAAVAFVLGFDPRSLWDEPADDGPENFEENPCGDGGPQKGFHGGNKCQKGGGVKSNASRASKLSSKNAQVRRSKGPSFVTSANRPVLKKMMADRGATGYLIRTIAFAEAMSGHEDLDAARSELERARANAASLSPDDLEAAETRYENLFTKYEDEYTKSLEREDAREFHKDRLMEQTARNVATNRNAAFKKVDNELYDLRQEYKDRSHIIPIHNAYGEIIDEKAASMMERIQKLKAEKKEMMRRAESEVISFFHQHASETSESPAEAEDRPTETIPEDWYARDASHPETFDENPCGDGGASPGFHDKNTCQAGGGGERPKHSKISYFGTSQSKYPDVASKVFGGDPPPPEEVAAVAGLPEDVECELTAMNTYEGPTISLQADNGRFSLFRVIRRDANKHLIVYNDSFFIHDEKLQGNGFGSDLFHREVERASAIGAKKIAAYAARKDSPDPQKAMNGYYTWPRLGYNAEIPAHVAMKLPPGLKKNKTLLQLMSSAEGRAWWKENGIGMDMTFDLDPSSESMRVHNAYMEERAKRGVGANASTSTTPKSKPPTRRSTAPSTMADLEHPELFDENPCGDGGQTHGFHEGNQCQAGGGSPTPKKGRGRKPAVEKPAKAPKEKFAATQDMLPREIQNVLSDRDLAEFRNKKHVDDFVKMYQRAAEDNRGHIPTLAEIRALAQGGEAAKGQYGVAGRALKTMLGDDLARAYSAINGILSARSDWEKHTIGALRLIRMWVEAGRPTDDHGINQVFNRFKNFKVKNRQGQMVEAYSGFFQEKQKKVRAILKDVHNVTEGQIAKSADARKTKEFFRSMLDEEGIALDTHMSKLLDPPVLTKGDKALFSLSDRTVMTVEKVVRTGDKRLMKYMLNAQQKFLNPATYNAYKAAINTAATQLGWEPKEVMEAVWASVISTAVMKSKKNPETGKKFTSEEIVHNLTNVTAGSAWDVASLLVSEDMKNEFRRLGVPEGTLEDVESGVRKRFNIDEGRPEAVRVGDRAAFTSAAKRIPADTGKSGRNLKIVTPSGQKIERFIDDYEFFADHGDPDNPGVMVALMVPPSLAKSLAVPGGEKPDTLHVTLLYLGRLREIGTDAVDRARGVCRALAESVPPFSGTFGGVGRFSASESSDGKDVFYASPDVPGLSEFRADLAMIFEHAGVPFKKNHGFTPHVTLKYINKSQRLPVPRLETVPVLFPALSLVVGDKADAFPFGAGAAVEAMAADPLAVEILGKLVGGPSPLGVGKTS